VGDMMTRVVWCYMYIYESVCIRGYLEFYLLLSLCALYHVGWAIMNFLQVR
jgi:hypothetical protein